MKRRSLLAAAVATAAARPALAQPALGGRAKTLVFVPQGNLVTMDPVWTTAAVTRCAGLMVFETLYGRDANLRPHPQMVEGHVIEDDGKRWVMTLREGLTWHDGTKVLARDCVASLNRWMKRDPIGTFLTGRMDSLEADGDRKIVWRLKKPFAGLANALAKTQPSPVMMPERLANTDPFKQIPEVVGSGPFRWVQAEYNSGNRAVFARNEAYVPRGEAADYASGGYRVHVDRVEWKIIPDAATAANALVTGEVDWVEMPLPDLLPLLRKAKDVKVGQLDPYGIYPALRPNFMHPPLDNPAIRRAILAAVDQVEVMTGLMGDDTEAYRAPVGYFIPGSEAASEVGMEAVRVRRSPAEVRKMLADAGYRGEKLVVMHPTDQPFYDAITSVYVSQLRKVGLNIDEQSMDWGTIVQRRNSKEPLEKGGWSLFMSGFPAVDQGNPILASPLRTNGDKAWYGWPVNAKIESLREQWIDATDPAEQKRIAEEIQREAFSFVPYAPLGQYLQATAWRSNLSGLLRGPVPVFWNVQKA